MADTPINPLLSSNPSQPVGQRTGQTQSTTLQQQGQSSLPTLQAFIQGTNAHGNTVLNIPSLLSTPLGVDNIAVSSGTPLPKGSNISLTLLTPEAQLTSPEKFTARITVIDGKALSASQPPGGDNILRGVATQNTAAPQVQAAELNISMGTSAISTQAVMLSVADDAPDIFSILVRPSTTQTAPQKSAPQNITPQVYDRMSVNISKPDATVAKAPQDAAQQPVNSARALMQAPPQHMPAPALQSAATSTTFPATVIGSEAGGEVVLRTSLGIMKTAPGTQQHTIFQTGAQLMVEVSSVTRSDGAQLQTKTAQLEALISKIISSEDGNMQEVARYLNEFASHPMNAPSPRLPSPAAQDAARALWFLSNVQNKTGDARSYLGERSYKAMQEEDGAGANRIFSSLTAAFEALRPWQGEQVAPGWNMFVLPMFEEEGGAHSPRIYVADEREREDGTSSDVRFVVQTELEKHGALQIDGFVARAGNKTHVTLQVSSETEFDSQTRSEIYERFESSLSYTGITGVLTFETTPHISDFLHNITSISSSGSDITV